MLRSNPDPLSVNESTYLLQCISLNLRSDGRSNDEYRNIRLKLTRHDVKNNVQCEVWFGQTKILCAISAELVTPYVDRPTEGHLLFNVDFSPLANPEFEVTRPGPQALELQRILEKVVSGSKAIDTEALCVLAHEKVWSIRCDIRVIDDRGNIIDPAIMAVMTGLKYFKLPDVTIIDQRNLIIHSFDEREPIPLPLHHIPLSVTFALFNDGQYSIVDPTDREELVMDGKVSFSLNAYKEVCSLHKLGGASISRNLLLRLLRNAAEESTNLHKMLNNALEQAEQEAKEKRKRRISLLRRINMNNSNSNNNNNNDQMNLEIENDNSILDEILDYANLHTEIPHTIIEENNDEEKNDDMEKVMQLLEEAAFKAQK